jgi:molybdenum cofactor synthesis domain-containing protein
VITGTEVLAGRVRDRNGPWLADRLAELGVELAHVLITGDRPDDLESALRFMRAEGAQLIVTSGGLGPTADDLTAEVVAGFAGRPLRLDEDLERRIAKIIERFARRWNIDEEALRIANRKQAMVPEGAIALDPVGTAPGLVVPADGQVVVVLPGPPRELQGSWAQAVETEPFKALVAQAPRYRYRMLRLFGIPESEIAETLRIADQEIGLNGLEVTTCLRRGELEVVVRSDTDTDAASDALAELIEGRHQHALFSVDGSSIEEQVTRLLGDRGGDRRIVHRRTALDPPDRPARLVTQLRGRRRGLLERGQDQPPGSRAGVDRAPRRGVGGGGRSARRRRDRPLRGRLRDRADRSRRAGWRNARQAGRAGLLQRDRERRRQDHPGARPAGIAE